jgi:hypothetical protein
MRGAAVCLVLLATACRSAELGTPSAARSEEAAGAETPEAKSPVYRGPATSVGRGALRETDAVVRAKLTHVMTVGGGAEVGRLAPEEWLRGAPREAGAPETVLTESIGSLPAAGLEGLFLLRRLEKSGNWELVESIPLDDEEGPERLAAFRRFLEIEEIPGPSLRMKELREYLRAAVLSDRSWTRWNAAREYASLARDVPGALTAEDRPPLQQARDRATDRALRALLDATLAACPGARAAAAKKPAPRPSAPGEVGLAEFESRFAAPGASAADRRRAVVDAAVRLGERGAPLFERALSDSDPTVREAGAAAAGEFRIASLEPKIASMLPSDQSSTVRRTLVVASGRLKSSASIPALALLAKEGSPFALEASFALARVRDDAAMSELRRLRAEAKSKERSDLLDFLMSDAFLEQERAVGAMR